MPGWLLAALFAVAVLAVTAAYVTLRLEITSHGECVRLRIQVQQQRAENAKLRSQLEANLDVLTAAQRGLERTITMFLETAQTFAGDRPVDQTVRSLLPIVIIELMKLYKGHVIHGGVLVPDPHDQDWLVSYAWEYGPAPVLTEAQSAPTRHYFYIGSSDVMRRSIAGEAWRTGKPQRCHVDRRTGAGDHPAYKPSPTYGPGEYPYESMIAIPLCDEFLKVERLGPSPEQYGVLCLDSPDRATFDSDALFAEDLLSDAFAMPFLREMFRLVRWANQSSEK